MAVLSQTQQTPGIKLSQGSAGALGSVTSSVNLFRGDVNLPVGLVSLQGRNGLDMAVSAFYGSAVRQQVGTWNQSAPTGVLGVGWSIPFERIVVGQQLTGSNLANDFFLVTGGSPKQLAYVGAVGQARSYELLDYQSWTIHYYPNPDAPEKEYWEIRREDGFIYTYGLEGIEWGVRWGNWIGSTTVPNGIEFPTAWNLVHVQNPQGDEITFQYENTNIPIGPYAQPKYTRSSRLSSVIDCFGQKAVFVYGQKEPFEIQPPSVPPPPSEQNAVQYRLEEMYLDRIDVFNEQNQLLLQTFLGYEFLNVAPYPLNQNKDYNKRYLTSITQQSAKGQAMPGMAFDYWSSSDDVYPGAIKTVAYPQGGTATYRYEAVPLQNTETRVPIGRPSTGYSPGVWHGPQYVVVTWQSASELILDVYSWGGEWRKWGSTRNWKIVEGTLRVSPGDGFCAVWFQDSTSQEYRLYLLRSDPYRFGEWESAAYPVLLDKPMKAPQVAVGKDFVAVADQSAGQLKIVSWDINLDQWVDRDFLTPGADHVALAAGTDYCLMGTYKESSQELELGLYFRQGLDTWVKGGRYSESVPIDWKYTTPETLLAPGPSFVAASFIKSVNETSKKAFYGTRLLTWSVDFQFGSPKKGDYEQALDIQNPIGYAVARDNVIGLAEHLFRYDGAAWQPMDALSPVSGKNYSYVYGSDAAIAATRDGTSVTYKLFDYSPYTNSWKASSQIVAGEGPVPAISIGGNFRTIDRKVEYRDPKGLWTAAGTLPLSADLATVQGRMPVYIAAQDKNGTDTWITLLHDGAVGQTQQIAGEKSAVKDAKAGQSLDGPSAFVTYQGDTFDTAQHLYLYRVIGASLDRRQTGYVVSELRIDDGYSELDTYYEYDTTTATYDPSGQIAQFVRVKEILGDPSASEGYTENIYFNGLNPEIPGVVYPPTDTFTNARNFFSRLNGQLYQARAFDGDGRQVQSTTNYLYTYCPANSDYNIVGTLTRQRKTVNESSHLLFPADGAYASSLEKKSVPSGLAQAFADHGFPLVGSPTVSALVDHRLWKIAAGSASYQAMLVDGELKVYGWLTGVTELEYNEKAQLKRVLLSNCNSEGTEERLVNETIYAWELYPELERLNILGWAAGKKAINVTAGLVTESTRTTFRNAWGASGQVWSPWESYNWNGTGDPGQPVPSEGGNADSWLKTSEILQITDHALPVSTADSGGFRGGVLYDVAGRFTVAALSNVDPGANEASYYGFETYEDPRGWALRPVGVNPNDYINAGDASTGERRLSIPGDPAKKIGLANRFNLGSEQRKYLLACWIKTESGFVEDPQISGWQLTVRGASGQTATTTVPIGPTSDRWEYFHAVIDPWSDVPDAQTIEVEVFSRQDHKALLVDDVFFVPLDAQCRVTVYDPVDKSSTATVDFLGSVRRIVKDAQNRPVAEVSTAGQPLSLWADYLWRQNSNGAFNPEQPSSSVVVSARGAGFYTDFRHGEEWRSQWSPSPGWQTANGVLAYSGSGEGTLRIANPAFSQNYGIRILLSQAIDGAPLGIRFGSAFTVRWIHGIWQLLDATGQILEASPVLPMDFRDLMLIATPHGVLFYVDGQLVLRRIFANPNSGSMEFFTDGPVSIGSILVFSDPVVGMTYLDNVGRALQTQALDDRRVVVYGTTYDALGRAHVATRSAAFEQTLFGFRSGFTAPLNAATGAMLPCELTAAYPEDEGYPFSRTRFEASPLSRPIEQSQPGKALAIDPSVDLSKRHTVRTSYALNAFNKQYAELPPGQYLLTTNVDPDGTPAATLADRFGTTVAGWIGSTDPSAAVFSRSFYDAYGNLIRAIQPNAFDPNLPDSKKFVRTNRYDFFGNVVWAEDPDSQYPIECVYDSMGRLRFLLDANGVAGGYLIYQTYDSLGRVAEEGICRTAWNRSNLQAHANDRNWLPSAGLWMRRYTYDGDGHTLSLIGRLWKTESCEQPGSAKTATETEYAYGNGGQIVRKTTRVMAYDGGQPHSAEYEYDLAGNVTKIGYSDEAPSAFAARFRLNGFNEVVQIKTQTAGGIEREAAGYVYGADGQVLRESLVGNDSKRVERDYGYQSGGWLASIDDPFVSEKIFYTQGGYGGAGYFTGKVAGTECDFKGVSQTGFASDYAYQFAYDSLGRLTVAKNSLSDEWSYGVERELGYDDNTNLTLFERGGKDESYTYFPGTNRLKEAGSGSTPISYDGNGNVVALPALSVQKIVYDALLGSATSIEKPSMKLALGYDSGGMRVLKSNETTQRLYVPDAKGSPLVLRTKTGGVEQVEYLVYGPMGLVAMNREGRSYPVLRTRLGSTRGMTDGTSLLSAYNYLPNGGFMGGVYDGGLSVEMPYLFTGQELDAELGLYNFKTRFYDPSTARFLTADPSGQYPSPYVYAGGDVANGYDPSGGFSWSWAAFGAVLGGVLAIIGGIALTIVTAGAATPFLVAGVIGGGMLIGAGLGSAGYGLTHADADKSKFDVVEWGISIGLGAAFGGLAAGVGLATAGLGLGVIAGLAVETLIGIGMGAVDGYVNNGAINAYHNVDFNAGGGTAALFGAGMGAVGGAIGGVLGRGSMLRTNRTVRSAGVNGMATGRIRLATQNTTDNIWHSVIGTNKGGRWKFSELITDFGDDFNTKSIFRGGQATTIEDSGTYKVVRDWVSDNGRHWTVSMGEVTLPLPNITAARQYATNAIAVSDHGAFNFLTNGCTSWARDVLRTAGIEPPLWTLNATGLEFWVRTLGRRKWYSPT